MGKPRVVFHILIESGYEVGLIEQTLRSTDYNAIFVADTEALQLSQNELDILLLEPSMSQWVGLDLLIKFTREYPDLPVILYSRDISVENDLQALPGGAPVYLAGDVLVLKEKLGDMIEDIMRRKEGPTKSVLFVDDEPNVLSSYTRMLRKSPWRVLTALSAEKALEILEGELINLVVTDIKMPQVHGIELVSRIREKSKDLPVIVCSAYHGMKDDQSPQFHEIADFVEKPVESDALIGKIEEVLGRA
jgi:DNA-binding NtrC family response regulator